MNDFDSQEANRGAYEDAPEDFGAEISDLPPSTRSHYLLIGLKETKKRLHATAREFLFSSNQNSEQNQADDFDVEISDLPPSTRSHYLLLKLAALGKWLRAALPGFQTGKSENRQAAATPMLRRTRRRIGIGRALTALGICATVLVLIAGNIPALRAQVLGFFEPGSASVPVVSTSNSGPVSVTIGHFGDNTFGSLHVFASDGPGPLPSSCPKLTTLQTFTTPLDPPGLGGWPLWLSGFDGPTATLVDLRPAAMSQTMGNAFIGWYEPVAVFIQRGFTGSIILKGQSQENDGSVMFSYGHSLTFAPSLKLSLDKVGAEQIDVEGMWEMIPINILVSNSGCYSLQATWANDGWFQYFAAGD